MPHERTLHANILCGHDLLPGGAEPLLSFADKIVDGNYLDRDLFGLGV